MDLRRSLSEARSLAVCAGMLAVVTLSGCGGSGTTVTPVAGNTAVSLVASSVGNDKLYQINLGLTEITLTNKAGKTVNLLSSPANPTPAYNPEFVHLNGAAEPLVTVTIPQDTYTSAAVSFVRGGIVCLTRDSASGGLHIYHWDYDSSLSKATVDLPTPLTVSGASMGLSLQLQVAKSSSITSCDGGGGQIISTTAPNFTLTPFQVSATPTSFLNGKQTGVYAEVDSLTAGGAGFTARLSHVSGASNSYENSSSYTLSVSVGAGTVYQGIDGFSSLAKGAFLDMDLEVQPDGTLLASRIAVPDAAATNAEIGQLDAVTPDSSELQIMPRQALGDDSLTDNQDFATEKAVFRISGQFANLASLPFAAKFDAKSMFAGQQVYLTSPPQRRTGAEPIVKAGSITLVPQTINGTVSAVATSGGFQVYTVTLADYDPIPVLVAYDVGGKTIAKPNQVQVYVDGSTQLLNAGSIEVGSTLRFNGLLFNDAGTLRMDCGRIVDGVAD